MGNDSTALMEKSDADIKLDKLKYTAELLGEASNNIKSARKSTIRDINFSSTFADIVKADYRIDKVLEELKLWIKLEREQIRRDIEKRQREREARALEEEKKRKRRMRQKK